MQRRKQQGLVLGVGQIAELDQHGGDIGGLQHGKAGKAVGVAQHERDLAHFMDQKLGEGGGPVLGLALGKIDQDRGDRIVLFGQIHPVDEVGLVLLGGQGLGLGVGGGFREGVDRAPRAAKKGLESACSEMNMSAWSRRAISKRSRRATNMSLSRVSLTR